MKLNEEEIIHPIFYLLFIGGYFGISTYSLYNLFEYNFTEILRLICYLAIGYLIHNILNTKRRVDIKKNEIINGIYMEPFGFVKINSRILIKNITEVEINQNAKKYFEINAKTKSGEVLTIKSVPNKLPAENELIVIKEKLKTVANSSL
ncbi:hypothetical protein IVB69_05660 [Flavobacterium sp. J49]|uniref:hypothetical protein n=1 Tax=Flavobacterium sp. J49 TaxID=2718534 RepID=UPI0015949255|nr:hypothetical protein [Flavobacterium sp. J49]MBF6640958.1 hypothetical protein [Flavobacterium sp. J49]NIC02205.1 hypothetical protein [Flavobacterium sp. J49]